MGCTVKLKDMLLFLLTSAYDISICTCKGAHQVVLQQCPMLVVADCTPMSSRDRQRLDNGICQERGWHVWTAWWR